MVHGRRREGATDPATPEAGAGQAQRDRPDGPVGPVLVAPDPGRPARVAHEPFVGRSLLDGARPTGSRRPGDETTGGLGVGVAAGGLLAQPPRALLDGEGPERLTPCQLEPLALASPRRGPGTRTDWSSSHVASLAGTTETSTFAALMTTSVGPRGAPVVVLVAAATRTTTAPAGLAPSIG